MEINFYCCGLNMGCNILWQLYVLAITNSYTEQTSICLGISYAHWKSISMCRREKAFSVTIKAELCSKERFQFYFIKTEHLFRGTQPSYLTYH